MKRLITATVGLLAFSPTISSAVTERQLITTTTTPLSEIEKASLLAGPSKSCLTEMEGSSCVNTWMSKLEEHSLVTEFINAWPDRSLPPQLMDYLEIDASNLAVDMDPIPIDVTSIPINTFTKAHKKIACCTECNRSKTDKICKASYVIWMLLPLCTHEEHKCCVNQNCWCGCEGSECRLEEKSGSCLDLKVTKGSNWDLVSPVWEMDRW